MPLLRWHFLSPAEIADAPLDLNHYLYLALVIVVIFFFDSFFFCEIVDNVNTG